MAKKIVVSGAVVVNEEGKILLVNDGKDPFYKIPGGKVKEGESLEDCAVREFKEETGLGCRILERLSTEHLRKDPVSGEPIEIYLYHFRSEILGDYSHSSYVNNGHDVRWIDLADARNGDYGVAPNVLFLIEKGDI